MRTLFFTAVAATALLAAPMAQAGCLTGAALGGVAGHVAGHHGILGAGAGCIAGHYHSKHVAQRKAAEQQNQMNSQQQNGQ